MRCTTALCARADTLRRITRTWKRGAMGATNRPHPSPAPNYEGELPLWRRPRGMIFDNLVRQVAGERRLPGVEWISFWRRRAGVAERMHGTRTASPVCGRRLSRHPRARGQACRAACGRCLHLARFLWIGGPQPAAVSSGELGAEGARFSPRSIRRGASCWGARQPCVSLLTGIGRRRLPATKRTTSSSIPSHTMACC